MNLFGKFFGKKPAPAKAPLLTPPPASPPPPSAPKTMQVWDNYGRVGEIPREEWRTKILPANFQQTWNAADKLAALINGALNDQFIADCLEPARQLHRIDPQPKRGATFLAIVLLQLKHFDEAEKILADALHREGEDGVLLTNLAKVHAGRGEHALAEKTLWHALELNPNLDNGFGWYVVMQRERGGEPAALDAMRRVAMLPGSWRAQLWLARAALQSRDLEQALTYYQEALGRAGQPVPAELLQQMSGDLGNTAHLPELLRLAGPLFIPHLHGLAVGNNLIKACVDLGQFDAARKILDQLYAQNRSDWKAHLSYWDTEIAKARLVIFEPGQKEAMHVTMLTVEGPVWLKPDSPAAELFPAHVGEGLSVAFLGCTAEVATNSQRIEHQMADAPGRLSRALPLFLAEQVEFNTRAHVQTIVPWMASDPPGFVLSGVPWNEDAAANYARQGERKSDYVVISHLWPNAEPWTVELRLVRTIDARCLGRLTAAWPAANPAAGLPELARQLLALLAAQAELAGFLPPAGYQVPPAPHFGAYLLRLEQLLAVRCAGLGGMANHFLSGEREIVDGNLQLCLEHPQNLGVRILLAQTLAGLKRVRPEILPEFKAKIALLQKEQPLPEPAQSVIERIFHEAFGD